MPLLRIRLGFVLPSINRARRLNFGQKRRARERLAWSIRAGIIEGSLPQTPFERARIVVTRFSSGTLDRDNLFASMKSLLDVLQPPGTPYRQRFAGHERLVQNYPSGLSIIVSDSPLHIDLSVEQAVIKRGKPAWTEIVIEELSGE